MTCIIDIPMLALYKRVKPVTGLDGLGAWIIRAWTGSPYSHAEIVIGRWWFSSSIQDGGMVRSKRIEYNPEHWDIIPLPWADAREIYNYFLRTEGQPYGWFDLFLQQFFRIHIDGRGFLCSGWCAAALGLPEHDSYYPGGLGSLCRWINKNFSAP